MTRYPLAAVLVAAVVATGAAFGFANFLPDPEPSDARKGTTRIVSLMPPITETLFEIGAGDLVVGRSDWCRFPPAATKLPTCGSSLTPSPEQIVRLAPDMIVAEDSHSAAKDQLAALAPASFLPWLATQDVIASTRRLGEIAGRAREAAALADELESVLLRERPEAGPRVLLVIGQDSTEGKVSFFRRNCLHGRMLNAAGGLNAVAEDVTGVPSLSIEGVITLDPEMVIVLDIRDDIDAAGRERIHEFWQRLTPLSAVRDGKVGLVNGSHFYGAGRRLLRAVEDLRTEIRRLEAGS